MMVLTSYSLAMASVFLWLGFVGAISFMEAWLKFRAPGVTITLGLGIGKLVFSALNKVEWILALAVLTNLIYTNQTIYSPKNIPYFIPLSILALQTLWLLPALKGRANLQMQGISLRSTNLHYYYVGLEIVKVICLLIFGIILM